MSMLLGMMMSSGSGGGGSNILYQPTLDGTEQITTMSGQNSPYITNNTLTGQISGQKGGSGYLTQGWDNTGLWKLNLNGFISNSGGGIIIAMGTTQRDYNLVMIDASGSLWRYNGSSGKSYVLNLGSLTSGFVNIEVENGVVVSMTEGIVPEPTPYIPQPTPYERLRADVDFIMAMEGYIQ